MTNTPDGNYLVVVQVVGVCAFSEPGTLFGHPFRCGGSDRQYQSTFEVTLHKQGVFGEWTVVNAEEDPGIVQRRNEAEQQARVAQETANRKAAWTDNLRNVINNNDYPAAQIALQNGADPNAPDGAGGAVLLSNVKTPEMAELLLKAGADVDGKGACPIYTAALMHNVEVFRVLFKAGPSAKCTEYAAQLLSDCQRNTVGLKPAQVSECTTMQVTMSNGK
jgi:hypothetical protein